MTVSPPSSLAGWFDATVGLVAHATSDLPRTPPYLLLHLSNPYNYHDKTLMQWG